MPNPCYNYLSNAVKRTAIVRTHIRQAQRMSSFNEYRFLPHRIFSRTSTEYGNVTSMFTILVHTVAMTQKNTLEGIKAITESPSRHCDDIGYLIPS